ncbi:MAG: hypothetical protein DKM50_07465 [Candidatus Margulisiibacteriota bacterium]|nr:MAG: hypothetical protein A2X43_05970 [Candidatus Margulisbacteria bacterium GWD2_39_127]OGI02674.1 MAG: hypothetical protein A2X42_00315 [Candidatus Margulisbacteria bacterium GWF2_38_17]OGI05941.1 MAG: hypothetical protein A2X41_07670 [Candidatus Margulisbacteria bacterium GWE2_39_32]PZM80005.1 MAG: hypothetical protein DKM50_07465 [Candidatus Margulisiibacteriota bacterium]HAR62590.1 hypothetical protein [Candidatus Margulisiibacteriota bacterium]
MDMQAVINNIDSLIQLDFDAAQCYDEALKQIDFPSVRFKVKQFRDDHYRHINNLSALVKKLRGEPVMPSRNASGVLIDGFLTLRSQIGIEGALKVLESIERTTNRHYQDALSKGFPIDITPQIVKNYSNEKLHIEYIQKTIKIRRWESGEKAA